MDEGCEFPDITKIQQEFAKILQDRLDCGLSNVYRNKVGLIVKKTSAGIFPLGMKTPLADK